MKIFNSFIVFVLIFGFSSVNTSEAATTPSLGMVSSYTILSSSYVNTIIGTTITGDIGFTTGPAVAPAGVHANYGSAAPYATAGVDQGSALVNLNNQACTFTFPPGAVDLSTDTTHGTIGVYTPGVYCTGAGSAASIGTGGITLSGAGTFIFRMDGALTTVDNSNVTLADSASSCDVFWTPTSATTLGANTTFKGTIISDSGITIGNTTSMIGRALAFNGTVTTDTDTITSTCLTAAPAPAPSPGGTPGTFAPLPLINVTKIPSPLALPLGAGPVTYSYSVTNLGVVPMASIWVKDNKCSNVNYISGDLNNDSLLDLAEKWLYQCTKTVSTTETNTVTAHGWANGWDGYDNANATVVVGLNIVPPLIHLVKIPSAFILPASGGQVIYRYTVTNPGTAALSNVRITDDKCTGLPGRVTGHPGDVNQNNLLESNETWSFTCTTMINQTTTNIGTAEGDANGLRAVDFSSATVVVAPPGIPNTGIAPQQKEFSWGVIGSAGLLTFLLAFYVTRKRELI